MPATKKRKGEETCGEVSPSSTHVAKRRRKGIQYDPAEICQEVYETVRNHKTEDGRLLCESFIRVPKRRNEPEYYDVITSPIDLLKVQSKLKNEEYDDIDQMTDDVSLMVKNAFKYYKEESQEFKDAEDFWDLYEDCKTETLARVLGGHSYSGAVAEDEEPAPAVTTEVRAPVKLTISLGDKDRDSPKVAVVTTVDKDDEDTDIEGYEEESEQIEGVDMDANKEDEVEGDNEEEEETEVEGGADDETSQSATGQSPQPKRRRRHRREVVSDTTLGDDATKNPSMNLREKQQKDFRSIVGKRGRGRPPKSSYIQNTEIEDSVSQDSRDDQSSSIADDDSAAYEELLSAVVNAKDGNKSLSDIFKVLPPKQSYPDYYDVIKEPMDLKIVAQKIQRNEYTGLEEMVRDLNLMCTNAKAFNEPGSEVYRNAVAIRKLVSEKRTELGSPRPTGSTRAVRSRSRRGQVDRISSVIAKLEFVVPVNPVIMAEVDTEEASETEGSVADETDSPLWTLYHVVLNYKNNLGQVLCEPFHRLPNRKCYPDYYEDIENPISLLKIKTKIRTGKTKSLDALAKDLDLMFENAKRYNVEASRIHKDAVKLQGVMKTKYREIASKDEAFQDAAEIEIKKNRHSMDASSVTSDEGTPKRKQKKLMSAEELLRTRLWSIYKAVLDYKLDGRTLINIFITLPSKKEYPDYFQVISEPIDMSMVEYRIKHDMYTSTTGLVQDLELMFNNARHYNQETSQVYKDAETLERILKLKVRSMPPMDGSPVVDKKPETTCASLTQRLQQLYNMVKDYRDSHFRLLSSPFLHLPSRQEYTDYYDIIRKPMDLVKILQKISSHQYQHVEELAADLCLMCDNACRYNEPDSLIYKDALTLMRVGLEKKQQLLVESGTAQIPDVRTAVQELMTNMFITVINHMDEEGRCYADSFQELPVILDEPAQQEGEKKTRIAAPSFARMKVNLDKGRYRRLDRFQEDLFQVFEFARRHSRSDSQLYEDAVELQMYFIKKRNEVCKNGEVFITPALSYTERRLVVTVDQEKKKKMETEQSDEGKKKDEREDDVLQDESEDTFVYNDVTYAVGDFVYVEPREASLEHHIVVIEKLFRNDKSESMLTGSFFLKPQETFHHATRKFLEKEVFMSGKSDSVPFSKVLGRCYVMSVKEYFKNKPEGFQEKDIFVCESRYTSKIRSFKKIKHWSVPKNRSIKVVSRDEALVPVRVASMFVQQAGSPAPVPELGMDEGDVLDKFRQVVEQYVDNSNGGVAGCRYFEQIKTDVGWFKIGDHIYVKGALGLQKISRIDRMWTDPVGVTYFQGPYYITPSDIEHGPTRTFYDKEVLKSSVEDTHLMSAVMGRCVVMPYRDYLACRFTEVSEKHVYLCESKYAEAEKATRKFQKPVSMIKDNKLSIHVCDDEVYFFPSPITPLKIPSPALLEITSKTQLDDPEDSNPLAFDESSNQMDTSFGDPFVAAFQDGTQDSFSTPDPEKPKKRKGKKGKSGYIMYASEFRKEIMLEHQGAGFGEISRIVGMRWKSLPQAERERYEAAAKKASEEARLKQDELDRVEALKAQAQSPMRDTQSPMAGRIQPYQQQTPGSYMPMQTQSFTPQGFNQTTFSQPGQQIQQMQQAALNQQGMVMQPPAVMQPYAQQLQQQLQQALPTHYPQAQQVAQLNQQQFVHRGTSGQMGGPQANMSSPQTQQMGPPPRPPPAQSPVFVSVPPRTQRLLHSEAYLKYIENLQPDRPEISNWRRQLTATEENTALNANGKLPVEWLGNGVAHHQNAVSALWALRDLMMKDVLTVSRTVDYNEV